MTRCALPVLGALLAYGSVVAQNPVPAQSTPLPQSPAPREDLVSFDCRSAAVIWQDRHWLLVAGDRVLKDFGRQEADARIALRIVQTLGLTQRGTVGSPSPVMEYWLADGLAPSGVVTNLRLLPLDSGLRVERIEAQWCLRDDQRVLFHFGLREEEARRALDIVRKYHFTHLGLVGRAAPSMVLFLSSGSELSGGPRLLNPSKVHKTLITVSGTNHSPAPEGPVVPSLPAMQDAGALRRGTHSPSFSESLGSRAPRGGRLTPTLPGWDEQAEWVPFDSRQVQVRQENGVWRLSAGGYVLASFGTDEAAAHRALAAVRHYHFTEHCRVGSPTPVFSYFLVNGQAPRGVMFGVDAQAFQPNRLSAQALGRQWALFEGDKVLLVLGESANDALTLLEAIRRNKFDRLCHVGPEQAGMTFLARVH
jgi:hypothetical protein